jgi:protein-disulfide isomerase
MRGRFSLLLLAFFAFAGCGASCKKGPETAEGTDDGKPPVELPGVDTSALVMREKRTFSKIVTEYLSPCGEPITLEVCVKENRACKKCMPAAKAVAKYVGQGEDEKKIREFLEARYDDKSVKSIDITGSPAQGPSSAPIVVVEFADFQCPHCAAAATILDGVLADPELKDKIHFVFKEYPLNIHSNAEVAARAAVAADLQGKFWPMHHLLFENQEKLDAQSLDAYAKQAGLDVNKFRTDLNSDPVKAAVAKDQDQGKKLDIQGTPSIFINGRTFVHIGREDFADELKGWLKLELQLMGAPAGVASVAPSAPASGSASAAPSGSASAALSASASAATKPSASAAASASAPKK